MRNRVIAIAAVISAPLIVAACAGGSSEPAKQTASSEKTYTFAIGTPTGSWIPAEASPADTNLAFLQGPYESLLQTDASGKIIPGLATEWKQEPRSLEFTLREGVTFSDGAVFDADAVKANFDYVMKSGTPPNKARLKRVGSIDVLGPTKIRLTLTAPSPELPMEMTRFLGLMASPKALENPEQLKVNPVGTGPYVLDTKKTVPNSEYVFDKNSTYWDKPSQRFDRTVVKLIPDSQARTNALLTGKVDAISIGAKFNSQATQAGYEVTPVPAFPMLLAVMDREGTKVPAFKHQGARVALSHAIDRESYFNVSQYGSGEASNQWTTPGTFGFDPSVGIGFDIAKAKSLMSGAGVTNYEFGIPSAGAQLDYAQPLVGFFAKIGVTLNLVSGTTGNISGQASSGDFAAALLPGHELHPIQMYDDFVSPKGKFNPFGVKSPEIDNLMKGIKGDDGPADEALYQQMSKMIAEQGIVVPMGRVDCHIAWNPKKVTNIENAKWVHTCAVLHVGKVHPVD